MTRRPLATVACATALIASLTAAGVAASPVTDDAVRALIALGYNQLEADRAVRGVMDGGAGGDVGTVVRASLARLTAK